ncbi:hypothetical protein R1flu_007122 [Riccia fluitans]|uniref:DDE Tnp4 domain-containing protein n=1 Tax=Riccia fluitans TaxID=41844 RepID=A0ABD1YXY0_9MARC
MRLPWLVFESIVKDLNSSICKQNTRFRKAVPSEVRVATCLHRLAIGASYFLVGDRFGIGETTAKECIPEVINAICLVLGRQYLKWLNSNKLDQILAGFSTGNTSSHRWAAKLVQACCILHNVMVKHRVQLDTTNHDHSLMDEGFGRPAGFNNPRPRDSGSEVRNAFAEYLAATL